MAAKRRQIWLGLLVLGVSILYAGHVAEVSPAKFLDNIGSFTSYFYRIAHLENGQWVISDPVEWFWGWKKWLALMGVAGIMLAAVVNFFGLEPAAIAAAASLAG